MAPKDAKPVRSALGYNPNNLYTHCTHPQCTGGPGSKILTTVLHYQLQQHNSQGTPKPACRECLQAVPKRTVYYKLVPGSERGLPPYKPPHARRERQPSATREPRGNSNAPTAREKELEKKLEAANKKLEEKGLKTESPPEEKEKVQTLEDLRQARDLLKKLGLPPTEELTAKLKKAENEAAQAAPEGLDNRKVQADLNSAVNRATQLSASCARLRKKLAETEEKAFEAEHEVARLEELRKESLKPHGFVHKDEVDDFNLPPPEGLNQEELAGYALFLKEAKARRRLFAEAAQRNLLQQAKDEHEPPPSPLHLPASPREESTGKPALKKQRADETTSMETTEGTAPKEEPAAATAASSSGQGSQAPAVPAAKAKPKEDQSWIRMAQTGTPTEAERNKRKGDEQEAKVAAEPAEEADTEPKEADVKETPAEQEDNKPLDQRTRWNKEARERAMQAQKERERGLADGDRSRSPKGGPANEPEEVVNDIRGRTTFQGDDTDEDDV